MQGSTRLLTCGGPVELHALPQAMGGWEERRKVRGLLAHAAGMPQAL